MPPGTFSAVPASAQPLPPPYPSCSTFHDTCRWQLIQSPAALEAIGSVDFPIAPNFFSPPRHPSCFLVLIWFRVKDLTVYVGTETLSGEGGMKKTASFWV